MDGLLSDIEFTPEERLELFVGDLIELCKQHNCTISMHYNEEIFIETPINNNVGKVYTHAVNNHHQPITNIGPHGINSTGDA